jgi:hypothetical protein
MMAHLDTMYCSCYNYDRLTVDVATSATRGLIHGPLPLHRPLPAPAAARVTLGRDPLHLGLD